MKLRTTLAIAILGALWLSHCSEAATKQARRKCNFRYTVDLSQEQRQQNGSYVYNDVLIPPQRVFQYDYKVGFRGRRTMVESHTRGCVCDAVSGRHCMRMCCGPNERFNETIFRCQPLDEGQQMPNQVLVRSKDGSEQMVNVFEHFVMQRGLPCNFPEGLSDLAETWMLQEDGTLDITSETVQLDTNSYCYTPYQFPDTDHLELWPLSCPMANTASFSMLVNSYSMAISVIFFAAAAIIYLSIRELRTSLYGKVLICYLTMMSIGYSILAFLNTSKIVLQPGACIFTGFMGYFSLMSGFLWLGVLGYDIWRKHTNPLWNLDNNEFLYYSAFVWGCGGILLLMAMTAQFASFIPDALKPGINSEMCWLNTRKWSAAFYFYLPCSLIFIMNIITFVRISNQILETYRNVARLEMDQKRCYDSSIYLLRLFIILGLSWIMDVVSYCVRDFPAADAFFSVTDFYNALQGVFVFIVLVCRRSILGYLNKRWRSTKGGKVVSVGPALTTSIY